MKRLRSIGYWALVGVVALVMLVGSLAFLAIGFFLQGGMSVTDF
jgi:hypothetical protein